MNALRTMRAGLALLLLWAAGGCAGGGGGLGNVLGSVLGGGQGQSAQGQRGQVQGTVRGVGQRQLALQLSDGQQVRLAYDRQTSVEYQNRRYEVANLEPGDQITAVVEQTGSGDYYVSAVRVDRSVQDSYGSSAYGGGAGVQRVEGVVRQIDRRNGVFSIVVGNRSQYMVSLPYNVSRADSDYFRRLRPGSRVRLTGVLLNNSRIELRQFY